MKQIARSTAPTPRALGFRMPAEWEPHETTWIAWPHNRDDWPGRFAPIPWVYGEIVRRLAQVERVRILVENQDLANGARRILKKIDVRLEPYPKAQIDKIVAQHLAEAHSVIATQPQP